MAAVSGAISHGLSVPTVVEGSVTAEVPTGAVLKSRESTADLEWFVTPVGGPPEDDEESGLRLVV